MKKTTFTRHTNAGEDVEQSGWADPEVPGLAVAKAHMETKSWETWSIYHTQSGRWFNAGPFRTRKEAEVVLGRVASLADWTLAVEILRAVPDLKKKVYIAENALRDTP